MKAGFDMDKPRLREQTLYLGDNGRCTCGRMRCAGTTAYLTGHDLSGQRMLAVDPRDVRAYGLKCETCKTQGKDLQRSGRS